MKFNKIKTAFLRRLAALAAALALLFSLSGCEEIAAGFAGEAAHILYEVTGESSTSNEPAQQVQGGFKLHFIDVGQALCVLIECDGQFMLYDGGNADDGNAVVSYLQRQGVQQLAAVFGSHPHEDHIGGLSDVLKAFPTAAVYSPVTQSDSACFSYFVEAASQQGRSLEVPAVGTVWTLGGATLRLLGPLHEYADNVNDLSLVLRIDYGSTSFLLTGDMESDAERDLAENGTNLKADVLQVGHHGSYSSTSYLFLNAVLPETAVISCGANNDYGHPHEEPLSRLRDEGATLYRTDLMGTIVIASDGENYSVAYEREASAEEVNPTIAEKADSQPQESGYIGNVNTKTFHSPTCASLPAEQNRILFSTYEEAAAAGYTPCGECKPAA